MHSDCLIGIQGSLSSASVPEGALASDGTNVTTWTIIIDPALQQPNSTQ